VRCLIDLGLRCSEVVKLQLDDVNWADGTINLVETKGGRADVLEWAPGGGQRSGR
jgi:integrase/recombinase XerD